MKKNNFFLLNKDYLVNELSKTTSTAMEFLSLIELIKKIKKDNKSLCEIYETCSSIAKEYHKVSLLIINIANGKITKSESVIKLLLESLFSYEESMRVICVKINKTIS